MRELGAEKTQMTLNMRTQTTSNVKRKLASALRIIFGKIFVYEEMVVLKTASQTCFKPVPNKAEVRVRLASRSDIPKLERAEKFVDGEAKKRFGLGHLCFVAEGNGKIISYAWVCFDKGYVEEIERGIRIGPASTYGYDEFTDPEYRGKGILPTLLMHESVYLFRNGIKEIYELVGSNNFPSLRSHQKIGSRKVGEITLLRLFGSRRYRCKGETTEDYQKLKEMFSI